ncbi:MAG: hypothetical protein LJF15_07890 [Acidobacteria bacterium]|jgi:hypothetical protein|nr:hypothetical protein [Acidobacteriota bacterium]
MKSREELEARVEQLETELARVRARSTRSVRKQAGWGLGNLPMWAVAVGADPERGEVRGHAKGIVAVGDIATGFVAVGGWARGIVALGGMATGLLTFGGLSIGVLAAVGGLAIGTFAFGGGAVGAVAVGGGAVGEYACGGGAAGTHVMSATRQDPEAEVFFREHGLGGVCPPQRRGWRPPERAPH